jgi:hypothetical protein
MENGPKWASGRVPVVRINGRESPRSAGFRPVLSARKRMSRLGVLAEGQELWSNPLCVRFQRLSMT